MSQPFVGQPFRDVTRVQALYAVVRRDIEGNTEGVVRVTMAAGLGMVPLVTDDREVADRMLTLARADSSMPDTLELATFARVEDVREQTKAKPGGQTP